MLVGREAERARLRGVLEAARRGRGTALVLRGEPGIGKTALLADLRDGADGFLLLQARGIESESRLAFAGLADLVRPVLHRLDQVPGPQQVALRAALALGPPAVLDRFAAYAAMLSLLRALAAEAPVLAVLDDAHWLDVPSQEALLFCARRIADEPIALVAASRERPPERLKASGLDEVELAGLSEDAARRLLAMAADGPLAPAVADELLAISHGNPLALLELPGTLRPDERAGQAALPRPLHAGEAVARAYRRRIESLDAHGRRALLLAAISDDGALGPLCAALGEAAPEPSGLVAAEAAGFVVLDSQRALMRHPLLRPAVLRLASPEERRAAHRALAAALDPERDAEARAWQLAGAALGPDEEAAVALERAAMRAAGRTGYAAAASALERAARLSRDHSSDWRRRATAAQMALAGGRAKWAAALLEPGHVADGLSIPPEAAHLRGLVRLLTGPLNEAFDLLSGAAERVAASDPLRASLMLADAVLACTAGGDCRRALLTAERAYALGQAAGQVTPAVLGYLAGALVLRGDAHRARPLLDRFDLMTQDIDPLSPAGQMVVAGAGWRSWVGDHDLVSARIDQWIDRGRALGAIGFIALPLTWACEIDFRIGRWSQARARGDEAVALLVETEQTSLLGYALASLATVEGGMGAVEPARRHASEAREAGDRHGAGSVATYAAASAGFLELSLGNPAGAVAALEPITGYARDHGLLQPATIPWQPDLVEAYVRLGRNDDARRALATLSEQAHRTGGSWARAATSRCRGLIADDFDRHFGEALALHALTPTPFERARTELAFGSRLRRAGRRDEARKRLHVALTVFETLGAGPWAGQAREELAASGARLPPRRAGRADDGLTPRELQVAVAVATGLTNREVGARLFLSEKTIERHLSAVYRKLGLRSRTQLAAELARPRAATAFAAFGGEHEKPET